MPAFTRLLPEKRVGYLATTFLGTSNRDQEDFERHVDYIHYNSVHHQLMDAPRKWPHPSFHRYVEQGCYSDDWGADREMIFSDKVGCE